MSSSSYQDSSDGFIPYTIPATVWTDPDAEPGSGYRLMGLSETMCIFILHVHSFFTHFRGPFSYTFSVHKIANGTLSNYAYAHKYALCLWYERGESLAEVERMSRRPDAPMLCIQSITLSPAYICSQMFPLPAGFVKKNAWMLGTAVKASCPRVKNRRAQWGAWWLNARQPWMPVLSSVTTPVVRSLLYPRFVPETKRKVVLRIHSVCIPQGRSIPYIWHT